MPRYLAAQLYNHCFSDGSYTLHDRRPNPSVPYAIGAGA